LMLSSRRNDYDFELKDRIDLCSEVSSNRLLLTLASWGNKGSSRSRVADVTLSLLETEEREDRFIDGVAYPRKYRELEETKNALHLEGFGVELFEKPENR
jgi:hypothetical protein